MGIPAVAVAGVKKLKPGNKYFSRIFSLPQERNRKSIIDIQCNRPQNKLEKYYDWKNKKRRSGRRFLFFIEQKKLYVLRFKQPEPLYLKVRKRC